MYRTTKFLIATAVCALPLFASAQTTPPSTSSSSVKPAAAVQPADAPRSNLEAQKTEQTGNAPAYGQSGTSSDNTQVTRKSKKRAKAMKHSDATSTDGSATDGSTTTK